MEVVSENAAVLLRVDLRWMQNDPSQAGAAVLGGDNRRASAHRRAAQGDAPSSAGRHRRASRPPHQRRTALRPPDARTRPQGPRRALAGCAVLAAPQAWVGHGPPPRVRPQTRRSAHQVQLPAHGSGCRAWRKSAWHRDRPCHRQDPHRRWGRRRTVSPTTRGDGRRAAARRGCSPAAELAAWAHGGGAMAGRRLRCVARKCGHKCQTSAIRPAIAATHGCRESQP